MIEIEFYSALRQYLSNQTAPLFEKVRRKKLIRASKDYIAKGRFVVAWRAFKSKVNQEQQATTFITIWTIV